LFYQIEPSDSPAPEDLRVLEEGLLEAGELDWQRQPYQPVAFFVRDRRGVVLGGVVGNTGGPWLYIAALWVTSSLRGRGIGSKLMDAVEAEASARGCTEAYLDTFSLPALEFYRNRGYELFGRLDLGSAHPVRHFLKRPLSTADADHQAP
jgi:GNAT superfamily N-acetyltransferase